MNLIAATMMYYLSVLSLRGPQGTARAFQHRNVPFANRAASTSLNAKGKGEMVDLYIRWAYPMAIF